MTIMMMRRHALATYFIACSFYSVRVALNFHRQAWVEEQQYHQDAGRGGSGPEPSTSSTIYYESVHGKTETRNDAALPSSLLLLDKPTRATITTSKEETSTTTSKSTSTNNVPTTRVTTNTNMDDDEYTSLLLPDPSLPTLAYYDSFRTGGYRNQVMSFTKFVMDAVDRNFTQILLPSIRWYDHLSSSSGGNSGYRKNAARNGNSDNNNNNIQTHGNNNNGYIPFEDLFDVAHWNSYSPQKLPRLVSYDPILHPEWNVTTRQWSKSEHDATKPYGHGEYFKLLAEYMVYAQQRLEQPQLEGTKTKTTTTTTTTTTTRHRRPRHPVDLLVMYQGALRPRRELLNIIQNTMGWNDFDDNTTTSTTSSTTNTTVTTTKKNDDYMAIHARVEPDMQRHPACPRKKEKRLKPIFQGLERLLRPPKNKLFVAINRKLLEEEVRKGKEILSTTTTTTTMNTTNSSSSSSSSLLWAYHQKKNGKQYINFTKEYAIAVENLQTLNDAKKYGLWGGTVPVVEAGASVLINSPLFQNFTNIAAAIVDFYLVTNAKIFIGTELSTFSVDAWTTRYHHHHHHNSMQLATNSIIDKDDEDKDIPQHDNTTTTKKKQRKLRRKRKARKRKQQQIKLWNYAYQPAGRIKLLNSTEEPAAFAC